LSLRASTAESSPEMRVIPPLLAAAAIVTSRVVDAQSLLDRSPNVSGDWTGSPGTLYFHFVHRFSTSGAPERKVTNVPTFLLGAGLPKRFLAGLNYSTNSTLAPRFPNEWELFARWNPLSEDNRSPIDIGGQVGYNNAADGVDGEVSVAKRLGIVRLVGAGRALSNPVKAGSVRYALAGAAVIRVGTYLSLAGDIGSRTSRDSTEKVAWSAGVHFAIPLTPHTVSIQVTNTLVETLQGVSRGTNKVRYGFEFTIPLTLRRYFGKRATTEDVVDTVTAVRADSLPPAVPPPAPVAVTSTPSLSIPAPTPGPAPSPPTPPRTTPVSGTVRTGMKNVNYLQSKLEITVGTTVEWTNRDPLAHSVTATDKSFNSGLIQPGKTFRHTFTKAGKFSFYCIPHPFMRGTIVVKDD
jgi:plastocyanin